MMPQLVVRPPSKTSSTISHDPDGIPPQPLDHQHEAPAGLFGASSSHDPMITRQSRSQPFSSQTAIVGGGQQVPEAVAFHKLPVEIIQRILWTVDVNSFASLAILNHNWYTVAQNTDLYAHHLSRCPSYALANAVITGPFRKNDLFRFKTKFAAEVRRNLFDAYTRPRRTLINLISVNASSSAALPGAEAFRFAFSPNGQTILALSSSRIYVIDATSDPIAVRNELKTMRRPLAASVTDDGATLAVLSSKHQANIYQLTPDGVKHVQVLVMDNPPRTIALAPEGTVLAAAYEGGVEVFSLAPSALSTDRRAVRSEGVDTLSFSGDGSMLVGSTQSLEEPSAVVITAPFYTENDLSPKEVHSRMWTTQILFPQISSVCSHAELLQGHTEGDANWLFAYDHTLMSYRAVRTDDTRTGVAYFLNPTTNRRFSMPIPSTAPTATVCGTLVVAGFGGSGLWIYGVPEKLDVSPDMGSVVERHEQRLQGRVPLTSATGHLEPLMAYSPSISGSSEEIEDDSLAAKVDWRESLFVKCQQIRSIEGCTAAKWVERCEDRECSFLGKRLVCVAPGGVNQFVEELGDETMPVDGSRVSILDFDYAPSCAPDRELTIEVGEKEPDLLTEQMGDMETEVAMERRRTVRDRNRGGMKMPLGRSVTTASGSPSLPWSARRSTSQPSSPLDVDAQMALANSPPRTYQPAQPNLHRSATAAGFGTARYPPRPPLSSQQQDSGHIIYARSPNQPYHSEEGWESPPPPYPNNSPGPVQSGGSSGSPTIQPPPFGGPSPVAMPLAGIPENGHVPTQNQPRPVPQGFAPGPPQPMHQQQAQFVPQPGHTPHQGVPMIPEDAPTRYISSPYAAAPAPKPDNYQLAAPNAPLAPTTPPFASSGSGESSSRPVSHEGRASPFHTPVSQRHPTPDRTSPSNLNPPAPNLSDAPANIPASQKRSSAGSLTLTGANLQARLNHPVPPTPTTLEQMRMSQYEPPSQPVAPHSAAPPPTQASVAGAPYSFVSPTADQMANLNRRVSQTSRKPVAPISTNGAIYQNPGSAPCNFSGGSGVPPSPPRGAWGAAGVPGSPSFNKAIALPNGLSRNNSRGSGRSIPVSTSTPNLHVAAAVYPPRPKMGRLDTIDSVPGSYGPGEPGSRSHNAVPTTIPSPMAHTHVHNQPPPPSPHAYPLSQPQIQPQFQQTRSYQATVWAGNTNLHAHPARNGDNRRVSSDPTVPESSKKKKGKRRKGEPERGRSQTPMPTTSGLGAMDVVKESKKEKGSKCIVM
ncbi:uncharacterized protein Z518_10741 [Rhinocladiella mackenziei CBS 650.93]|uniref:Rhinocladiella mackenziei CBS 650.93 unplaced genomic scaffold supercont1.10, whole genome shotgun sequence n=1 Tax=Rhinocladiella mackenziei CBS 650.93 TaxID=1442369 RepID=A0A0D2I238_9EURO|nr:uncharacterized protein Z518_10741 [Rhinocladiella mackenziei CBS 650.93]KIW99813.1 hypothetical protein Z518_10741 [Rhinocladiella mackenziei CBS 650.93]